MDFCGVICEFNPFHNGHDYLIKQAKKQSGKEIVCLMSGNFVQRGEPAIANKFDRASWAIKSGANAVLELPTIYSCSNAENFAMGAIKIFKALGIKEIAFGVEHASLEILDKIAKLKAENSLEFRDSFKNEIQNGINFNTALKRAIAKYFNDEDVNEILNSPNNVLAIEYLTAIKKQNAEISALAIERCDKGFISDIPNEKYLGATAIRELVKTNQPFKKYLPEFAIFDKHFDKSHKFALETMQILKVRTADAKELEQFYDYSEGIEYRIKEISDKFSSLDEIIKNVASPRYREPRVKKLLLYPLLGITKEIQMLCTKTKPAVKVLAIDKKNKSFLSMFDKSKISLIVTNNDYENLDSNQKKIYDIDLLASEIYRTIAGFEKNDKKMGTLFV